MATLSQIAVHPIKALDPVSVDSVGVTDVGGLVGDRIYAIVDEHGHYVNGKRTTKVHPLHTEYDLETDVVRITVHGEDAVHSFALDREREALEDWLSEYFGVEIALETGPGGSLTDGAVYGDGSKTGPTLISAASLREIASWFDGIDTEEMRDRLRPNLVVEGVPAFWEDRLVSDPPTDITIGDVTLQAESMVPRCSVPGQHPRTGEVREGFRERFIERREATLPAWTDRDAFDDSLFEAMVSLRVPEAERDGTLAVGDTVTVPGAVEEGADVTTVQYE